ncbi:MAG: ABC transporter permease [Chloroflexota bacterium]
MAAITPASLGTKIEEEELGEVRTLWQDVWIQFRKHRGAMFGLGVLIFLVLFAVVGPWIYRIDPQFSDLTVLNQGPSADHWFGTDAIGRDMFAMMMAGGRISIMVGFTAMFISVVFGTTIGIVAGYFPMLDGPLMRVTDLFFALPILPLRLVVTLLFRDTLRSLMGPELGIFVMIVTVMGLLSWMSTARVVRGEVLAVKQAEFVTAAKSIGTRKRRILIRHIFPNVLGPVMVASAVGIANAIITESALSFLGLGFPSDFPTWGRLIFEARDYMRLYPLRLFWPGLAISLTVLSVNFIGDGLRDALDPRLRGK